MEALRSKKWKWVWIAIVAVATLSLVATSFLPYLTLLQ